MTVTTNVYPSAPAVYEAIKSQLQDSRVAISDWDEYVWDFLSDNFDLIFVGDTEWFDPEDVCVKDHLRDEVLDMFGFDL